MKLYWFNKKCCVAECWNSSTEGEGCYKEYFDLPAEPHARSKWLEAILCDDGEDLKICEDHFDEDHVFLDKNHRKKLRLNSIPSRKLPQYICNLCFGMKQGITHPDFERKTCHCSPLPADDLPHSAEKRPRIMWTTDEKKSLFKTIKKYGEAKISGSHIRINWKSVISNCRNLGCLGNEKEIKSAWQYMRIKAFKVYRNEVLGSKLDRKVAKFLFGKSAKIKKSNSSVNGDHLIYSHTKETSVNDDTFDRLKHSIGLGQQQQTEVFPNNENNDLKYLTNQLEIPVEKNNNNNQEKLNELFSDSDDEYYSIDDIEHKLGIKIRTTPEEVVSLLSSDESELE